MYGRGAADDKSGIVVHAAAIRALLADGPPPVSIKVVVEGEEECSTEHLPELVQGNADLLRADVAVIADGGNYRTGVPTLNSSIRGVTDIVVQVRVLPRAQHSGSYGGPIPDAITALARIIASLHHDDGSVAIEGLQRFGWTGMQIPEDEFREESGVLDQVELIGAGTLSDRLLTRSRGGRPGVRRARDRGLLEPDRAVRARPGEPADRPGRRPGRGPTGVGGPPPLARTVGGRGDVRRDVRLRSRPRAPGRHDEAGEPRGDGCPGAGLRTRGDRDGIRRLDPARPDARPRRSRGSRS